MSSLSRTIRRNIEKEHVGQGNKTYSRFKKYQKENGIKQLDTSKPNSLIEAKQKNKIKRK